MSDRGRQGPPHGVTRKPSPEQQEVLMAKVVVTFRSGGDPLELEQVRHRVTAVTTSNASGIINHVFTDRDGEQAMVPQDVVQYMVMTPSKLAII